jgi:hypothetical protein
MIRIEARRGRESHAMGVCGAMGQGVGGGGVSRLLGAGRGRGAGDLTLFFGFRFLNLVPQTSLQTVKTVD